MKLSTLTDPELYRLAFDISEELIQREAVRLQREMLPCRSCGEMVAAHGSQAGHVPVPHDSASDNYGGW